MRKLSRFGRKLTLPSVSVIKHKLRMMTAADGLIEALQGGNISRTEVILVIENLAKNYNLSASQVYMLMDRLEIDRKMLKLA